MLDDVGHQFVDDRRERNSPCQVGYVHTFDINLECCHLGNRKPYQFRDTGRCR